jgi:hypothetical protein
MGTIDYRSGQESVLGLVRSAQHLLQTRSLLTGTSDPYAPLADSALADIMEIISGMATELSIAAPDDATDEWTITDEPLSFNDAIRDLPMFLHQVVEVIDKPTRAGDVTLCHVATRAQTVAFCLRERG